MPDEQLRIMTCGEYLVDLRSCELFRNGQRIPLQGKPFALFVTLLENAGELVSRRTLYDRLWSDRVVDYRRGLDTAMKKLRAALRDSSQFDIETLPGRGYRLNAISGVVLLSEEPPVSASASMAVAS